MAFTKTQTRTLIQQLADDANAKLWSAANLDLLTQLRHDALWIEFHDFQAWFTSQLDTLTSLDSPGFIDTRLTATGDLSKRILRVQAVTRNSRQYTLSDARNFVLEGDVLKGRSGADHFTYTRLGDQLHLFPYNTADDVEIRYAHLPTAYDGIADGTDVDWPEGHEMALIADVATWAMAKGGGEDVAQMRDMAKMEKFKLIDHIARTAVGPLMPFYSDDPGQWGGD